MENHVWTDDDFGLPESKSEESQSGTFVPPKSKSYLKSESKEVVVPKTESKTVEPQTKVIVSETTVESSESMVHSLVSTASSLLSSFTSFLWSYTGSKGFKKMDSMVDSIVFPPTLFGLSAPVDWKGNIFNISKSHNIRYGKNANFNEYAQREIGGSGCSGFLTNLSDELLNRKANNFASTGTNVPEGSLPLTGNSNTTLTPFQVGSLVNETINFLEPKLKDAKEMEKLKVDYSTNNLTQHIVDLTNNKTQAVNKELQCQQEKVILTTQNQFFQNQILNQANNFTLGSKILGDLGLLNGTKAYMVYNGLKFDANVCTELENLYGVPKGGLGLYVNNILNNSISARQLTLCEIENNGLNDTVNTQRTQIASLQGTVNTQGTQIVDLQTNLDGNKTALNKADADKKVLGQYLTGNKTALDKANLELEKRPIISSGNGYSFFSVALPWSLVIIGTVVAGVVTSLYCVKKCINKKKPKRDD